MMSDKPTKNMTYCEKMHHLEQKQLREAFHLLDQDHDGIIMSGDLIEVLTEIRLSRKSQLIFDLITSLGEKDRKITVEDFIAIIQGNLGQLITRDGLRKIFRRYDQKNEGFMDWKDIDKIAQNLGQYMDEEQIKELLRNVHVLKKTQNVDRLAFEDFYRLMVNKHY